MRSTTPDEELRAAINRAQSPEDLLRAFAKFLKVAEESVKDFITEKQISTDCHHGCSWCCYARVNANPHEVFLALRFVRDRFDQDSTEDLRHRLERYREKCVAMSINDRNEIAVQCPFLIAGKCSIYPARPMVCRAFHSRSKEHCERSCGSTCRFNRGGAPISQDLFRLWERIGFLANHAFEEGGFAMPDNDFAIAFLVAMNNPALVKRWRQRKIVFLDFE